jgi:hypothetical protein
VGERGNAIEALTGTGAGGGNPLDALGSLPLGFIKETPGMIRDWSEAYLRWREVQEERSNAAAGAAAAALGIGTAAPGTSDAGAAASADAADADAAAGAPDRTPPAG